MHYYWLAIFTNSKAAQKAWNYLKKINTLLYIRFDCFLIRNMFEKKNNLEKGIWRSGILLKWIIGRPIFHIIVQNVEAFSGEEDYFVRLSVCLYAQYDGPSLIINRWNRQVFLTFLKISRWWVEEDFGKNPEHPVHNIEQEDQRLIIQTLRPIDLVHLPCHKVISVYKMKEQESLTLNFNQRLLLSFGFVSVWIL